MPKQLVIVAEIVVKPDQVDLVKNALLKLIEPTRKEKGCLQYDLHQDNENSNAFLFYERWGSRELWQDHMSNAHLAEYMAVTKDAVADFKLHEMSHIA